MKIYDLENHFYPKELFEHLKTRTEPPRYNAETTFIDYEGGGMLAAGVHAYNPDMLVCEEMMDLGEYRISQMDKAGLDVAVLSAGAIAEYLPREEAIWAARLCNDAVAEAVKRYPGRFMGTICLPTPYVDAALEELDRAVNVLGLKYWHTHCNYGKHYIYEDMFDPILDKCAEYDIAFYIHPQTPSDAYLLDSGYSFSTAGFGYGVDVMKASLRLIMKGTFDKHPNLKMILGHMAEFYPYILSRLDNRFGLAKEGGPFYGMDPLVKYKESFTYYFKNKNIFMTTSGILDELVVDLAIRNIGIDNIMLGSDFPYEQLKTCVDFVKGLPISEEDKEKILGGNAEKYILKV